MKTGLVLEGGSMRGLFTAGVLDVFMENGIEADCVVGVSAGAVFGCNFKSRQIGRTIRYNTRFCRDRRYASFYSWITSGDVFNAEFDYKVLPGELDPFDSGAFKENPMEFFAVATDAETGRAVYLRCEDGGERDLQALRASASMPGASNIVEVDGMRLSDGGTADSIPLRFAEGRGCDRIVVITTQPLGFVKEPNPALPLLRIALRRYPRLIRALETRHVMYNEQLDYLAMREKSGDVLAIRPPQALKIKAVEHDENVMRRVYAIGRETGERYLPEVKALFGGGV